MLKHLLIVVFALVPGAANAQQSTIYGSDGKVIGRATIDSQGTATIYSANGKVIARETASDLRKPRVCPAKSPC